MDGVAEGQAGILHQGGVSTHYRIRLGDVDAVFLSKHVGDIGVYLENRPFGGLADIGVQGDPRGAEAHIALFVWR